MRNPIRSNTSSAANNGQLPPAFQAALNMGYDAMLRSAHAYQIRLAALNAESYDRQLAQMRRYAAKVQEQNRRADEFHRSRPDNSGGVMSGGSGGRWADLGGKAQVFSLAAKGAGLMASGVKSIFDSEAGFEKLLQQLASTADGTESLRDELTALAETAKMPGLGFREAIQGAASFKSIGLNAKDARAALEQFGNALTNSGRGKADLEAVVSALEQMVAGKLVDEGNLKEISRRIRDFREMTAGLDKQNPLEWVKGVVERLKELPRAVEGAQDKLENLKDAADQKLLGLSGGKVAGVGGTLMSELANFGAGKGFNAGALVASVTGDSDLIKKMTVSDEELARRKKARADAEAKLREEEQRKVEEFFAKETKQMEISEELGRARLAGDRERVAVLEDELYIQQNLQKLVKELGVSEAIVTEKLQEHLKLKRDAQERDRKSEIAAPLRENAQALEVAALRSRGRGRAADRLEEKYAGERRQKQLETELDMKPAAAKAQVDRENRMRKDQAYFERTGRRRIHGAESEAGFSGLDGFSFTPDEGKGFTPRLLDTNPRGGVPRLKSRQQSPLQKKSEEYKDESVDYFGLMQGVQGKRAKAAGAQDGAQGKRPEGAAGSAANGNSMERRIDSLIQETRAVRTAVEGLKTAGDVIKPAKTQGT